MTRSRRLIQFDPEYLSNLEVQAHGRICRPKSVQKASKSYSVRVLLDEHPVERDIIDRQQNRGKFNALSFSKEQLENVSDDEAESDAENEAEAEGERDAENEAESDWEK